MTRLSRTLAFACLRAASAALCGCSALSPRAELSTAADPALAIERTREVLSKARQDYRIAPQDVLMISVPQQEDIKIEARVNDLGQIDLPVLGAVTLGGMTASQARKKLRRLLSTEREWPQVNVSIKEQHACKTL